MPELPEVETVRRDLEKEAVGKKIKTVEVKGLRSIRRHPNKKAFVSALEGRKITSVTRRGKNLLVGLDAAAPDTPADVLVVHLGMSGQLLKTAAKDEVAKHTHVTITFTQGGQLRFVDPRTFGELYVASTAGLDAVPDLSHLGFDPVEDALSWERFAVMLRSRSVKLKTLLMDQRFVAGLGNIYTDEILWAAGMRHDRLSDSVSPQEVRRLYRAMVETLQEAIKHRGSSLADEQYRDLFGAVGQFQKLHNVYDREGLACPRCRHPIVREKVTGRSTFYCASCQV